MFVKMKQKIDKYFWNNRYINGAIGWDIGKISNPLREYFDQLKNKEKTILIPGCGNSYEAEYLHKKGFANVYILDYSSKALENFKLRVPSFPRNNIIKKDFFSLNGKFDLIIEQTFFCALEKKRRYQYVLKIHELLKKGGKAVGVLFNQKFESEGPPFGGDKQEYYNLFSNYFQFKVFNNCYNSISQRSKRELFFIAIKTQNSE